MNSAKTDNERISAARVAPARHDSTEASELQEALGALEISEADDPTRAETDILRRDVIDASVALERKQRR